LAISLTLFLLIVVRPLIADVAIKEVLVENARVEDGDAAANARIIAFVLLMMPKSGTVVLKMLQKVVCFS